LVSIY